MLDDDEDVSIQPSMQLSASASASAEYDNDDNSNDNDNDGIGIGLGGATRGGRSIGVDGGLSIISEGTAKNGRRSGRSGNASPNPNNPNNNNNNGLAFNGNGRVSPSKSIDSKSTSNSKNSKNSQNSQNSSRKKDPMEGVEIDMASNITQPSLDLDGYNEALVETPFVNMGS